MLPANPNNILSSSGYLRGWNMCSTPIEFCSLLHISSVARSFEFLAKSSAPAHRAYEFAVIVDQSPFLLVSIMFLLKQTL